MTSLGAGFFTSANSQQPVSHPPDSVFIFNEIDSSVYTAEDAISPETEKKIAYLKKAGFAISEFHFPIDDYSGGFSISVYNLSKSTVKYLYFTISVYNPVDDLIATKTVKGVGPIKYAEKASYEFENVFYSRVIDFGRIRKIKVQYMNGATKEYSGKLLDSIIL